MAPSSPVKCPGHTPRRPLHRSLLQCHLGIRLCKKEVSREGSRAFHCKPKERGEKDHTKLKLPTKNHVFHPKRNQGKQYHLVHTAKDSVTAWSEPGEGSRTQQGGKLLEGRWQQAGITPGQSVLAASSLALKSQLE